MELYLLRHGIAEDFAPGARDADRQLTAEGKKKLRQIFKTAAEAEVKPALILTSPYKRAAQTAALAAKHLDFSGEILETSVLVPESDPAKVWDEIRIYKSSPSLLLVAHEPLLSRLSSYLLNSPAFLVDFKKGALMRIDCDSLNSQPKGVLRWYLTPRLTG